MGNCNSTSIPRQLCKTCGLGPGCDCTAGLDSTCGKPCDQRLLYNVPGTYDYQYDVWLSNNPRPVPPAMEELVPITFNIQCSVCSQSIQQGVITAGQVTQGAINQTMSCFNDQIADVQKQVEKEAADAKTAAEAAAAQKAKELADALAAEAARQAAAQKAKEEAQAAADAAAASAAQMQSMMIMVFIFIVVVILAVVGYMYMGSEKVANVTTVNRVRV